MEQHFHFREIRGLVYLTESRQGICIFTRILFFQIIVVVRRHDFHPDGTDGDFFMDQYLVWLIAADKGFDAFC